MCSDSDADALLDATKVMKGFEFHAEERKSEKPSEAKSLERRKRERTTDFMSGRAEQTRRPVRGSKLAWQGERSTRGRQ